MLLKPVDELREFDVPDYALAELSRSRVKRVDIVGRRGPLQLAGTTKELRELLNLPQVAFETDRELLAAAVNEVASNPKMEGGRARKRAMGLLEKGSKTSLADAEKSWSFQFLRSPTELLPSSSSPENVGAVSYALNALQAPSDGTTVNDPNLLPARPTGEMVEQKTDAVFKSVGYRSVGIPGLPFDERRGVVRNVEGRVTDEYGETVRFLHFPPVPADSVCLLCRSRVSTLPAGSLAVRTASSQQPCSTPSPPPTFSPPTSPLFPPLPNGRPSRSSNYEGRRGSSAGRTGRRSTRSRKNEGRKRGS
jgi:hypothetical protein